MAASSSMDSVFSQYHRELWDRYRLLFAEYETGAEMEADFAGFLLPYLETDNWYPMALEAVSGGGDCACGGRTRRVSGKGNSGLYEVWDLEFGF